jgi:hypothetical protein
MLLVIFFKMVKDLGLISKEAFRPKMKAILELELVF